MASSIFIVRHGDRFDFDMGWENWKEFCHPDCVHDPPLSDVGLVMAIDTASVLSSAVCPNGKKISKVLTSPFLRCIQTAHPTAAATRLPLCIEDSLFEVPFNDEPLPPPIERSKYFPQICTQYESAFRPANPESFPEGAISRYMTAARTLANRFSGENIVLVTHAAGVMSMVAALCRVEISAIPPAAPCGIYRLDLLPDTGSHLLMYTLATEFRGSVSHLRNSGKTTPWPIAGARQFDDSFLAAGSRPPWL
jgi:broad specificity phosphatase PhoE